MSDRHWIVVPANETRALESVGPDLDEILRDLLRSFMAGANQSPQEISNGFDVTTRELNKFLKGERTTLLFASKLCAAMGLSLHDLLCTHSEYKAGDGGPLSPSRATSITELKLYRFGRQSSEAEVELALTYAKLSRKHPELKEAALRGLSIGVAALEARGKDNGLVEEAKHFISKALGELHVQAATRSPADWADQVSNINTKRLSDTSG